MRWREGAWAALAAAILVAGCADEASGPKRWACPESWVQNARGGCGPAVVLCAPGGGASPGACDGVDLSRAHPVVDPEGTGSSFYLGADGEIAGGWPAPSFEPVAGIPSCADGWRRTADGTCDPALRADCPDGSAALPGGACTPTADADCPATEYPDVSGEVGSDAVYHVRAGADGATADGSSEHPYASIARALSAAAGRGWILVAAGTYTESLVLRGSVHVVGVCAARAAVAAGGPGVPAMLSATAGSVPEVRGLAVGGPFYGIVAGAGARITIRASRVERATGFAILAQEGGSITVERSLVRATLPDAGSIGIGLQVQTGSSLVASHVVVEQSAAQTAHATEAGSSLVIEDSVLRSTTPRPGGIDGVGVRADEGARATVARTLLEDHVSAAMIAEGPGTTLEATDVVARRSLDVDRGDDFVGLVALHGGSGRLARVLVDRAQPYGALAYDAGSAVELEECVVRGTRPNDDDPGAGSGVMVLEGASAHVARSRIEEATTGGVVAAGAAAELAIEDSVVLRTRGGRQGYGVGLLALSGGHVSAARVLVAQSVDASVAADGDVDGSAPAHVELSDSVLRDNLPRADGDGGAGIVLLGGSVVRAERTLVLRPRTTGIWAGSAGVLTLRDSAVREVTPSPYGSGDGISCIDGNRCTLTRVLVEDAVDDGLIAWYGAELRGQDLLVRRVRPSIHGFGIGVFVASDAVLDVERLFAGDVAGAGIAASTQTLEAPRPATVRARDVLVRGVRSSQIQLDPEAAARGEVAGYGPPVSYGIHAATGCTLDVARATLEDAGYGFFAASGTLAVSVGVITRQLDGAGASDGPASRVELVDVAAYANADDSVRLVRSLPAAAALPPPTPVCLRDGC